MRLSLVFVGLFFVVQAFAGPKDLKLEGSDKVYIALESVEKGLLSDWFGKPEVLLIVSVAAKNNESIRTRAFGKTKSHRLKKNFNQIGDSFFLSGRQLQGIIDSMPYNEEGYEIVIRLFEKDFLKIQNTGLEWRVDVQNLYGIDKEVLITEKRDLSCFEGPTNLKAKVSLKMNSAS